MATAQLEPITDLEQGRGPVAGWVLAKEFATENGKLRAPFHDPCHMTADSGINAKVRVCGIFAGVLHQNAGVQFWIIRNYRFRRATILRQQ